MRPYDIALFGVTGFTGRLVAGELLAVARAEGLRLAFAGRSRAKMEAVVAELAATWPEARDVPLVEVDITAPATVDALAAQSRVIATTVGPYGRYGEPVVAACARAGTHYCDLTGEVPFMRAMIDAWQPTAVASGARIVFACGYDSIPSDLGAWFTERAFAARFGRPATRVVGLAGETKGGFSGGTVASMADLFAEATKNPEVRRILGRPYSLNPNRDHRGADGRDAFGVTRAPRIGLWTAPFVMAPTNTRVVRRSHALLGEPWGADFRYEERMSLPKGLGGLAAAWGIVGFTSVFFGILASPLRPLVLRFLPAPGEGPDAKTRTTGFWRMRFVAEEGDDWLVCELGDPNGDPGYASTARMLSRAAVCLARDPLTVPGGMWTPASALAEHLVPRLEAAGLTFVVQARP